MQGTAYSAPLERLAGSMPFQSLRKPRALPGGMTCKYEANGQSRRNQNAFSGPRKHIRAKRGAKAPEENRKPLSEQNKQKRSAAV